MPNNFVQVFKDTLQKIQTDAKDAGINLTSICRETGISRATPDRWLKKPPKTVLIMAEMQQKIEERRADIAKSEEVRVRHGAGKGFGVGK